MTRTNRPGQLALVGSGEYLPQMAEIERGLFDGRPPRYVQLATAAVPDGADVVARWHDLGRRQAQRLGVEAVIVPVTDRASADDPQLAKMIEGAGVIYLSGGDPHFLAGTLRDTAVWAAIRDEWKAGAALAGCSAGAMVMASRVVSFREPRSAGSEGLGLLPHLRVVPHFDRFSRRLPGMGLSLLPTESSGTSVVGVDEDTAIVGGPETWTVKGRGSAWTADANGPTTNGLGTAEPVLGRPQCHRAGSMFTTPVGSLRPEWLPTL